MFSSSYKFQLGACVLVTVLLLGRNNIAMAADKRKHLIEVLFTVSEGDHRGKSGSRRG